MPLAENAPENESPEREVSPEISAEQERGQPEPAEAPAGEQPAESGAAPADQGAAQANASKQKEKGPLSHREIVERESGVVLWLTLAIGAGGLLLMFLLPWVQVYYPNVTQAVQGVAFGVIELSKDEVVHLSLRGTELLTFQLWPLLVFFLVTIGLFGAAVYWRKTRFVQTRLAWLVLALGLVVGVGFPVELWRLFRSEQRVDWSNVQATIEDNQGIRSYARDDGLGLFFPCPFDEQRCNSSYIKNAEGRITFILHAGVTWRQITPQGAVLANGQAESTRASANSSTVTTSGFAIGTFGNMGASIGYWGAWIFSLWTLINALLLLRRLARARAGEPQTRS